jgi:hypothetical protein
LLEPLNPAGPCKCSYAGPPTVQRRTFSLNSDSLHPEP